MVFIGCALFADSEVSTNTINNNRMYSEQSFNSNQELLSESIRKAFEEPQRFEATNTIGGKQFIFPFGEALSASKHDDVSVQFQYNFLNTEHDVRTFTSGAGAAVSAVKSLAIASTTTTGETAYIYSRDSIRYKPGHSGFIDFTLLADTTNGYVHAGGFDVNMTNGFVVQIENDAMKFGFFQDGVKKGSDFALGLDDVNTTGINLTNLNIYRIVFGYLGIKNPTLYASINGEWIKLHEVQTEGKGDSTHTETPVFPMIIMAHDGASCKSGSWNGGVIGNGSDVGQRAFTFPNSLLIDGVLAEQGEMTLSLTNVGTIAIFNSRDTFHDKTNNVKAALSGYRFEIDIPEGTNVFGTVIFQIVAVNTLSGTPTYTNIDTNSSVMRYNHTNGTGASVEVLSGKPIITEALNYVSIKSGGTSNTVNINAEKLGAFAYRGDTFAVIAKDLGGNNVTVRAFITWNELF